MLNNDVNLATDAASQARVSAKELTEALASLEARKARQDFEQVGTVTLNEAIQECSVAATPEELQAEIDALRDADAMQEKVDARQRRLRLALKSELFSAALCLLILLGLKHTLLSRTWQHNYQAKVFHQQTIQKTEDFEESLRLSTGPNPEYEITAVFDGRQTAGIPTYPIYCLPDGCNIHHYYESDQEQFGSERSAMMPFSTVQIAFKPAGFETAPDNITVIYEGHAYWRGYVLESEIPHMLQGKHFTFYSVSAAAPRYPFPKMHQVTLSMASVQDAHGQIATSLQGDSTAFSDGNRVHLDQHVWEAF